jgi:hypothetical protein
MTRWKGSDDIPRRIKTLRLLLTPTLILIAGLDSGAKAAEGASSPRGMLDLTKAVVVVPEDLSGPEKKAVTMLVEEVGRRSGVRWEVKPTRSDDAPIIAVGQGPALSARDPRLEGWLARDPAPSGSEGYRILTRGDDRAVLVVGNDPRGVLFGIGRLLRELRMTRGRVFLPAGSGSRPRRAIPCAGTSWATAPRRTPTTAGTSTSGSATSATWPSSAPTPSN